MCSSRMLVETRVSSTPFLMALGQLLRVSVAVVHKHHLLLHCSSVRLIINPAQRSVIYM